MEKIEIVNLYNRPIVVNIKISTINSKRISIVGGHLNMTLKPNYKIKDIENTLTRILSERKIKKLISEPFIGENFVDILGIRRRLVNLSLGHKRIDMTDFVVNNENDLNKKLKDLSLDIISSRVRKYQMIMEIPVNYTVKITNMRSSVGKNYYQKKLLTFDKNLIHYSLDIIDSVVVHELAHHYQQNHSKQFYDILLKYLPNYHKIRERMIYGEKRWLKRLLVHKIN